MHLKRWITAVAALPFLILLILRGGSLAFAIFICIICILALREYHRITSANKQTALSFRHRLLAYIIGPALVVAAYGNAPGVMLILIFLNLILSALASMVRFTSDRPAADALPTQVLGIVYIPWSLSFLVAIRNGADGVVWIFFLLVVIFAGDIGAYYVGTFLGRHKLAPSISPGKTIEGSAGGIAANIGAGFLFTYLFLPSLPWAASVAFFVVLGVAGQVGDLFESKLKRAGNIKDSGGILPGHGGILDRIDALLFAAPLAYMFKEYIF